LRSTSFFLEKCIQRRKRDHPRQKVNAPNGIYPHKNKKTPYSGGFSAVCLGKLFHKQISGKIAFHISGKFLLN